jgi:hypothetical protein
MSRKTWCKLAISAAVALVLAGGTVLAEVTFHAGPTFVQVGTGEPFTFNLSANMSGLGSTPAVGTIVISAEVLYTCRNNGGKEVPGQNPVPLVSQGSQEADPADHNGRGILDLTVSLAVPDTISADVIGCPNGNWIGINPVLSGAVTATASITFQGTTIASLGPLVAQ